jgi:hypothetical protein
MKNKFLRFFAYLGCSLIFTYPLVFKITDHCWGSQWDLWSNFWLFGYLKQQLAQGQFNLLVKDIYYPFGLNLWFMGHFLVAFLSVPLQYCFSLPMTYNLLLLLFLTSNAWGLSLLLEYLTSSRAAAFLGGLLFLFNTFIFAHMQAGSGESLCFVWIPLMMLCAYKLKDYGNFKYVILTAVFLVLAFLTNWFYGAVAGIWLAGFSFYYLVAKEPPMLPRRQQEEIDGEVQASGFTFTPAPLSSREREKGSLYSNELKTKIKFLSRILAALILAFILLSPLIYNLKHNYSSIFASNFKPQYLTPAGEKQYHAFNDGKLPLAELNPDEVDLYNTWELFYSSINLPAFTNPHAPLEPGGSIPGIILIALGLLGFILANGKLRFWLFNLSVFFILSLGLYLRWDRGVSLADGKFCLIPMPYYFLYKYLPLFHTIARPERLQFMVSFSLAVAAGFLFAWLFKRSSRTLGTIIFILLLPVIMLEVGLYRWGGYYEDSFIKIKVPQVYSYLSRLPGEFAVIEVPFNPLNLSPWAAQYQFYQIIHKKKTLNALLIRSYMWFPLAHWAKTNSLVNLLVEDRSPPQNFKFKLKDLKELSALKFKYLLVHTQFLAEPYFLFNPEMPAYFPNEAALKYLALIFAAPKVFPDGILVYDLQRLNPALKLNARGEADLQAQGMSLNLSDDRGRQANQLNFKTKDYQVYFKSGERKFSLLAFYLKSGRQSGSVAIELLDNRGKVLGSLKSFCPDEDGDWKRVDFQLNPASEIGSLKFRSSQPLKLTIREAQALP